MSEVQRESGARAGSGGSMREMQWAGHAGERERGVVAQ